MRKKSKKAQTARSSTNGGDDGADAARTARRPVAIPAAFTPDAEHENAGRNIRIGRPG